MLVTVFILHMNAMYDVHTSFRIQHTGCCSVYTIHVYRHCSGVTLIPMVTVLSQSTLTCSVEGVQCISIFMLRCKLERGPDFSFVLNSYKLLENESGQNKTISAFIDHLVQHLGWRASLLTIMAWVSFQLWAIKESSNAEPSWKKPTGN